MGLSITLYSLYNFRDAIGLLATVHVNQFCRGSPACKNIKYTEPADISNTDVSAISVT